MMYKGRYTPAACSLARLIVSTGTAEAKVGSALVEIRNVLGITINRCMNKHSVQRVILEKGVAAVTTSSNVMTEPCTRVWY